jgi:Skp family chaperone for outer membrane proteins
MRLALLVASVLAGAQAARAETEIAALNVARVFELYEMTRDLETLFDQARREAADDADKRRDGIEQQRKALVAFDPVSEDYRRREQELDRAELEFQVWSKSTERRLKGDHLRWMRLIYKNTQEVIAQIAQERSLDMVLTYDELTDDAPDSMALRQQILLQKVIYHDKSRDITDEVLRRLNEAYRKSGGIRSLAAPESSQPGGEKPAEPAAPRGDQGKP